MGLYTIRTRINILRDIAKNTLDKWIYFLKNEEIEDKFKAKIEIAINLLNILDIETRVSKYGLFTILKLTNFWIVFILVKVPKNSTYNKKNISKN